MFCASSSSANLFAFTCRPPGAWVDGRSVFSELDVEYRLARSGRQGRCGRGAASHSRNRFPGQYELTKINGYPFHPRDENMISAPRIEDQELAVTAERPCINHPSITRCRDLRAGPGRDGKAFFGASDVVRAAEFSDSHPVDGQWKQTACRGKGDGRPDSSGILQDREFPGRIAGRF